MYEFTSFSAEQLSSLIKERKPFEVELSEKVARFRIDALDIDLSVPREIAPTAVILTAEGIAHLLICGEGGLPGRFMRFHVLVYALGGKIHFSKKSDDTYLARVTWPIPK